MKVSGQKLILPFGIRVSDDVATGEELRLGWTLLLSVLQAIFEGKL
jgi:hypothetical protein